MTAPSSWLLCRFETSLAYFEHLPVLWHKKMFQVHLAFLCNPHRKIFLTLTLTSYARPPSWPETFLNCLDFDNPHRLPSHMNSLFTSLNQKYVFIPRPTSTSFMKTSLSSLGLRSPFGGYTQFTHSSFKTPHSISFPWVCPTHSDQAPTLCSKATFLHGHCPPPHSVPGCHVTCGCPCSPYGDSFFTIPTLAGTPRLLNPPDGFRTKLLWERERKENEGKERKGRNMEGRGEKRKRI